LLAEVNKKTIARKPCDAAAVLPGLKLANNIHYKFKSSQASIAMLQSSKHKTEFIAKWPLNVIQSHMIWSQWKGDKGLNNTTH